MDSLQLRTVWWDDLRAGNAAIKAGLHDCSGPQNSDTQEASPLDNPPDFGDHVDHGQRRFCCQSADAKMTGNGSDGHALGTGGDKALVRRR